ncbi:MULTISPECIES: hypothetical protein [unclassified Pseudomonas]|uniref:hypothetical protein n=1 Tax=unclassified Pseudomonas TaxID=196821 RepID=UPI0015A4ECA1|nr:MULTISPECIES: hypothetical protein [unclassified Pseudomonas]NWC92999.1 hypothetical protein [Pseudomonas sp. IPO3779]NWD19417.1 hypothetical protein [Pseudomonas sp. IPO3778]
MSDLDFTLCNISIMISRNKSKDYEQQVISRYTVLMSFLKKHSLILKEPFDESGHLKVNLIVKKSDVTEKGLELFRKTVPAWHAYVDKGGNVENITKLERALEKIENSLR